jgi:hypothetical protein
MASPLPFLSFPGTITHWLGQTILSQQVLRLTRAGERQFRRAAPLQTANTI